MEYTTDYIKTLYSALSLISKWRDELHAKTGVAHHSITSFFACREGAYLSKDKKTLLIQEANILLDNRAAQIQNRNK